ncbi:MAG: hypothetical protein ACOYXB_04130 [Bacteroidota bacterium]
MKKILYILLLSLLSLPAIKAQPVPGLQVGAGIGSYSVEGLKAIQQILLDEFPVEGQINSLFPPYYIYNINMFLPFGERIRAGVVYRFGSTGARASYRDYSGQITADQLLTMHQLGANVSYRLFYANYLEVRAGGSLMLGYTNDEISRDILITGYYLPQHLGLRAFSMVAEPGLEFLYHFRTYSFGIEAGYQYDFGGRFRIKDRQGEFFYNPNDNTHPVMTDISGFRAGIRFIIWFRNKEEMAL